MSPDAKNRPLGRFLQFGGEGGIRTLTFVYHSTNITFTFNDLRRYRRR